MLRNEKNKVMFLMKEGSSHFIVSENYSARTKPWQTIPF